VIATAVSLARPVDNLNTHGHSPGTLTRMSLPLSLALVDAAAGLYLLQYAVRHQRRDKGALLVTAAFLLVCAVALGWSARPAEEPGRLPSLRPAGELV
jgi:hypothetical protein